MKGLCCVLQVQTFFRAGCYSICCCDFDTYKKWNNPRSRSIIPERRSSSPGERESREERPRRLPAERKRIEVKSVMTEVGKRGIPSRLAPIPMPILLQERESARIKVLRRERGNVILVSVLEKEGYRRHRKNLAR